MPESKYRMLFKRTRAGASGSRDLRRNPFFLCSLGVLAAGLYSCCIPAKPGARQWDYPKADRGGVVDDYFGTKVADPYRWMEDADSPGIKDWERAESGFFSRFRERLPRRKAIRDRIAKLWNFPSYGLPWKEGPYYFFTENNGKEDQDVLYAQQGLDGNPRVVLDPNTLSSDGTVALTAMAASPDGKCLAYGTSKGGSNWKQIQVLNLSTSLPGPDLLKWVRYSRIAWTRDDAGFFYSCYPDAGASLADFQEGHPLSNHTLYYHRVGAPQSDDRVIYRPEQPHWTTDACVTDDGKFAIIEVGSQVAGDNLIRYLPLGDPKAPDPTAAVKPLIDTWNAQYEFAGNDGPIFYFQTNLDAPRYRIVAIDSRAPAPSDWKTVVPESSDIIQSCAVAGGRLVVLTMHDVASRLSVHAMDGRLLYEVPLPSSLGAVGNVSGQRDDPELLFSFTTYTSPTCNYRCSLATGEVHPFQRPRVDINPADFETTQVFYPSRDGTRVPMFITKKKGAVLDGTAPTILYGYGGFDVSLTPSFYVPNITWIEMGGVYAVANLRGGGEYGEDWHRAGMKQLKQNVFDDFIGAADWLFANHYTSPAHLVIRGRSNGGLLIGATINQRPDLCRVAFPEVGVMDMLRFQKFSNGEFWVSDYGSSDSPDGFRYLSAYSPLHTIRSGARYPAVCVIAADSDDKVSPAHSFKYTAAMQASVDNGPSALPVFIRIETQAGHGRGLARSKVIDAEADKLAFAAYFLGL